MAATPGAIQVKASLYRQVVPFLLSEKRDAAQTLLFANHCHGSLCGVMGGIFHASWHCRPDTLTAAAQPGDPQPLPSTGFPLCTPQSKMQRRPPPMSRLPPPPQELIEPPSQARREAQVARRSTSSSLKYPQCAFSFFFFLFLLSFFPYSSPSHLHRTSKALRLTVSGKHIKKMNILVNVLRFPKAVLIAYYSH